ncbi:MAG: hypothetical protein WKG07_08620 [Hymenobacter sp.]
MDEATGVVTAPLPAVEELPNAHQGDNPGNEPVATSVAAPEFF